MCALRIINYNVIGHHNQNYLIDTDQEVGPHSVMFPLKSWHPSEIFLKYLGLNSKTLGPWPQVLGPWPQGHVLTFVLSVFGPHGNAFEEAGFLPRQEVEASSCWFFLERGRWWEGVGPSHRHQGFQVRFVFSFMSCILEIQIISGSGLWRGSGHKELSLKHLSTVRYSFSRGQIHKIWDWMISHCYFQPVSRQRLDFWKFQWIREHLFKNDFMTFSFTLY